jgi:signal transduction histidine kinase
MKGNRRSPHLRLLFILAVIIPCLILGFIAIRSINREKAFITLNLQRTLDVELVQTIALLNTELDRIRDELAASAPTQVSSSPQSVFVGWKSRSELIQVPFLLSPDLEIVWPTFDASLSDKDRSFLNWNREFITDRVAIPVFQNIALVYKDEIAAQPPPEEEQIESIFISEPQHFSQITAGRELGLIPRFIEEKLTLIFWKRNPEGGFVGCVVDDETLRGRMARLLPNMYTQARILTILDESGRPLLIPEARESRDWSRPFVAREISERLPRWEMAAYLSDPDALTSRANLTVLILWILIFFVFVVILSGGTYILNTLRSEMQLVRQKTTFVTNVSHELKTPLTSIRMFAEMLKERRQPDQEKQEKYLDLMVSETDRLTRLINNVLDFTHMERGEQKYEKKRLDIALLCEGLVEGQRVRLEHNGFSVTFQNDLGEAFVDGDEESLMQALLNLCQRPRHRRTAAGCEKNLQGILSRG